MRWFRIRTANSINADLRRTFEQLGPGIMQVSLAVDSSFKHNGEDVWPHDLVHKPLRPFQISVPREIFGRYGGGRPRAKVDAAHIPRLRDSGASFEGNCVAARRQRWHRGRVFKKATSERVCSRLILRERIYAIERAKR